MAFHLHRIGLSTTALKDVLGLSVVQAREYRLGRVPLNMQDVRAFSSALNLEPNELARPLSVDESLEWRFYRVSARHVPEVWSKIGVILKEHRFAATRAASLVCIDATDFRRLIKGEKHTPVLQRPPACKLAAALGLEAPEVFIAGLIPPSLCR